MCVPQSGTRYLRVSVSPSGRERCDASAVAKLQQEMGGKSLTSQQLFLGYRQPCDSEPGLVATARLHRGQSPLLMVGALCSPVPTLMRWLPGGWSPLRGGKSSGLRELGKMNSNRSHLYHQDSSDRLTLQNAGWGDRDSGLPP